MRDEGEMSEAPLTLTLSRWERGPEFIPLPMAGLTLCSLSPRERVGVRAF